jgi:hypothetical protein
MVPMFKAGKIYFPEDLASTAPVREAMEELKLAAPGGFKSKHDDFIDTISMLSNLITWRPSQEGSMSEKKNGMWILEEAEESDDVLSSYIV